MGSSMTRNAFVAAARILTREQMLAAFAPLDGKDPTWIEVLLSQPGIRTYLQTSYRFMTA